MLAADGLCVETLAIRYQLVKMNLNWTDAQLYCNTQHTNLVAILNQEEHLALQAYIESNLGRSATVLSNAVIT